MTIHGDPDAVMKAARAVLGKPYGYMDRARATIDGPCRLTLLAFGVAPSLVLSGPHETCRSTLEDASKAGATTFTSTALGLGNVAHAMGGAEAANTLVPSPVQLCPSNISADGSDRAGAQAAVIAAEVMLFAEWLAVGGVLATCGALAPSAIAAVVVRGLVEPDDGVLSQAFSGWQSASQDVGSAWQYLEAALQPLEGGWPGDDTSRRAFDRWMIPFGQDVDRFSSASDSAGQALASAVDSVRQVQTESFVAASIALGSILALTALDAVPFMAAVAEPLKQVVGLLLDIDIAANVVVLFTIIKTLFDALMGMVNTPDSFDFSKPGDHTLPHFEQLSINWDH